MSFTLINGNNIANTSNVTISTLTVSGVATLGTGAILGTPASGTITNLTGTASININGTVGATTPAAAAVTTLSASGLFTMSQVGGARIANPTGALLLEVENSNLLYVRRADSPFTAWATVGATGTIIYGTLGVSGTSTLAAVNASGLVAMAGAATVGTTLGVTGAATLSSTLGVTGTSTLAAVNASGLVAMAGAATVGTTLGVTGATTLSSTLGVTGTSTLAAVNASGMVTQTYNANSGVAAFKAVQQSTGSTAYTYYNLVGNTTENAYMVLFPTTCTTAGSGINAADNFSIQTDRAHMRFAAGDFSWYYNNGNALGLSLSTAGAVAITGTLGVSGLITSTPTSGEVMKFGSTTSGTGILYMNMFNTSGAMYLGIEGSAGGTLWTNIPAYATGLGGRNGGGGISFSANAQTQHMLLTTTGLAVTGTLDATGTITSTQAGSGIRAKNDIGTVAVYNTANAGIIYMATVKGWLGSGANVTDGAIGTVGDMYFYGNNSATATAKLTSTGLAVTGTLSTTSYVGIGTTSPTTWGAFAVRLAASNYFGRSVSAAFSDATNSTLEIGHAANVIFFDTEGSALKVQSSGTVITNTSSTGFAVTGTLTATGSAAIGSTSFSGSQLYVTGTFGATAGITDAAIEVYVNDDGSSSKSGDRVGIKSVLYNAGRQTGKLVGLYTDVSEIDVGVCYGTYSKAAGLYGQQYAVYGEVSKNLAAYTAGYCFYGKATTTSSGGQVYFLAGDDNGTTRILAGQNGGLSNYQANDTNLSDRREKKDFAPAKSYLDVICAIPVQTFKYIDQKDDDLNLGVVAQDVQAVAPELVVESDWAAPNQESKVRLSVYQTDLQFALMKAIQELAIKNEALEARLAKLEAA